MPSAAARSDLQTMPAIALERAIEWSDLHFRPPITSQPEARWRLAAALFVLLLHAVFLFGMLLQRAQIPEAQLQRFEVIFIERAAAPALPTENDIAMPDAPHSKFVPLPEAKPKPRLQAVEVPHREPAPLRLHLAPDLWQQPDTSPEQNPLARRPSARLPGRAEPFVEGFRISQKTPEEVLRSIAIQYFGGVDPDPCPGARERLANLESNPDRSAMEADLRKVERYCRP